MIKNLLLSYRYHYFNSSRNFFFTLKLNRDIDFRTFWWDIFCNTPKNFFFLRASKTRPLSTAISCWTCSYCTLSLLRDIVRLEHVTLSANAKEVNPIQQHVLMNPPDVYQILLLYKNLYFTNWRSSQTSALAVGAGFFFTFIALLMSRHRNM